MRRWAIAVGAAVLLVLALLVWPMRERPAQAVASTAPPETHFAAPAVPIAHALSADELARPPAKVQASELAPASATRAPIEATPTEILVRGTVRDEHGTPVPASGISWYDDLGLAHSAAITDGSYAIPGMRPGHFLVQVSGAGWHREQSDVELAAQPAVQEHNFRVRANPEILIRVVDAGGAALIGKNADGYLHPELRLLAYASRTAPRGALDPQLLRHKASSDCARFQTHWERPMKCADGVGVLELFEDPPLFVSLVLGTSVLATRKIESIPSELIFALSAADLSPRLTSLRLRLLKSDGTTPASSGTVLLTAETMLTRQPDAEGRVAFDALVPGGYALAMMSPGSARQERQLVLEAGQALDLGDVTLAAPAKLRVRFTFPAEEQPELLFVLKPETSESAPRMLGSHEVFSESTRGGNPAEINFPGPGSYQLRVTHVGDPMSYDSLHLSARPQRVVLADAPAGEVVVHVLATSDVCLRAPRDAQGISHWLITTTDGLPCQRVRIEGRVPTRIELVPGEYTIVRTDAETDAVGKAQPFTVGSAFSTLDLQP